jgi:hypothetical protein
VIGGHTSCAHCGHDFQAPPHQAGSLQNCPGCGKATAVAGENDPLWKAVRLGSVAALVGAATLVHGVHGPLASLGMLAGGAALLLVARQAL